MIDPFFPQVARGDIKLSTLYLLDSIIKNHPEPYKSLFQQNIVSTFVNVFQAGEEKTRMSLHKLRGTWNGILAPTKLNQLDKKINSIDPAWPIAKSVPVKPNANPPNLPNIHINPAVFGRQQADTARVQEELKKKELELIELQKQKLELEVEMAKKQVAERKKMVRECGVYDMGFGNEVSGIFVFPLQLATGDFDAKAVKRMEATLQVCKGSFVFFLSFPML